MSDGLIRQRRNLIITCILLWMMKFGDVNFSKFSLVGLDVTFRNPDALILGIWIAFAYFLYRYYQYFSDEGIRRLEEVFNLAFEKKCSPIISQLIREQEAQVENNSILSSYEIWKKNKWKCSITLKPVQDPVYGSMELREKELSINPWKLWKGMLSAIIDSIFRNSVVTDYLLPFILACIVLYYCGSYDWNGSFFRFIFTRHSEL